MHYVNREFFVPLYSKQPNTMPTITFRTITQLSFTMDLEPSLTVAEVKKKIAEEKGDDYAVELQKLIYNGKILEDVMTIEQIDIDPNKFVVVMLSRRKAPESAPVPAVAPEPVCAQTPTVTLYLTQGLAQM
ncbi:ubiquitin family protein [Necator americanus]|uniref:Ubiquitin family protein n=1 Tax=Necator americanus TaxID=51031 RepID=W2TQP7_NECAM|nr:ubiquitin family protein [Necator americanus]ETN84118.1 ubiquitin family protein [Necator americanus]